jgi:hypothetical protein
MAERHRRSNGVNSVDAHRTNGVMTHGAGPEALHPSPAHRLSQAPAQYRDLATAALLGATGPDGAIDPANLAPGRTNAVDLLRCRVVWRLVSELFDAACARDLPPGVARRRPGCHMRQIAMYLSHVVLSVPYRTIAKAFGRDRSTVMHACAVVEDRRDDIGYDRFVERCERCVNAVFSAFGSPNENR